MHDVSHQSEKHSAVTALNRWENSEKMRNISSFYVYYLMRA